MEVGAVSLTHQQILADAQGGVCDRLSAGPTCSLRLPLFSRHVRMSQISSRLFMLAREPARAAW